MVETSASLLECLRDRRDTQSWQRFIQLYTPVLRHWLNRQSLQPADVGDLVQQVLTIVVDKLPIFDHNGRRGAFRVWLRAITVNVLRGFWRSQPARLALADPDSFLNQFADPDSGLSR